MNRGPEYREPSLANNIIPDQRKGHERFSLKSERGDAPAELIVIGGFLILMGTILYPVISDRVFEKRVENYCLPATLGPGYPSGEVCYNNVTPPEGVK